MKYSPGEMSSHANRHMLESWGLLSAVYTRYIEQLLLVSSLLYVTVLETVVDSIGPGDQVEFTDFVGVVCGDVEGGSKLSDLGDAVVGRANVMGVSTFGSSVPSTSIMSSKSPKVLST